MGKAEVEVGYEAYYAIYVHERLELHHPKGQAKFLERAFLEAEKEYVAEVTKMIKKVFG
jgi:hypothetical protein